MAQRVTWRTAGWACGWTAFGLVDGRLNTRHDGSTLSEVYRALGLPDWLTAGLLFGGAAALAVHLRQRAPI